MRRKLKMNEIALITVNRTLNYGTILQMYACIKIFKSLGYHTTVIDYHRDNDYKTEDFRNIFSYITKRVATANSKGSKRLVVLAKSLLSYKDTKRFFSICNIFMDEHMDFSERYFSFEDLKANPIHADVYCAGSDQIWNTDYNGRIDPSFFLAFVDDKSRKISFSSSIGKDSLSEHEKSEFHKYLEHFKAISVREVRAQTILQDIGLKATALLDPTLIIDLATWQSLASPRIINEPYLLLYKLKGNDLIDHIALSIAKEKKLKVVRIAFGHIRKHLYENEVVVTLPTIPDFLSYIANADYIVTNSFHGTCFSINFQKQFSAVPRDKYNSRIVNILTNLDLSDRLCESMDHVSGQMEKIEYSEINKKLIKKRTECTDWLSNALTK